MPRKTKHQKRIIEFMRKAKQDVPEQPTEPSPEVRLLRAKLILEEAFETVFALGVDIEARKRQLLFEDLEFVLLPSGANLVEVADGCADISVVTIGTLVACGISDEKLLEEVDQNNLDKFGPGHTISPSGKLLKPPGHKPPNIKAILDNQRKE